MQRIKRKNIIKLLTIAIMLILGIFSCSDNPVDPPGDKTAPQVSSVSPLENSSNISVNTTITANFSEKISPSSVTITSFSLDNAVSGSVSLTDSVAIFTPSSPLGYNQTYTVTLTTAITDLAGNHLASNYTFSFTTEEDPALLPPAVVSVSPSNNGTLSNPAQSVQISFSKAIDTTTINSTNISFNNGITGVLSYDAGTKTVTFVPDTFYIFDTSYTVTVTTGIKDTMNLNMISNFTSTFFTQSGKPNILIYAPSDSSIISDFTDVSILGSHPVKLDSVNYYFNGSFIGQDTSNNFTFSLDASGSAIASENSLYAVGYSATADTGYSDTLTLFYEWMEVWSEGNDGLPPTVNDLRKMFARSTDSTLELRYQYGYDWSTAYLDTSCLVIHNCGNGPDTNFCSDTAIDLAIYLDADLNQQTGVQDGAGQQLNDIGAEYRVIIGFHGGDDAFARYNSSLPDSLRWETQFDTTGFTVHSVPQDTNIMEIGIRWEDMNFPAGVNIVNANAAFLDYCDPNNFIVDFMPDRSTNTHVTIFRENKYLGVPSLPKRKPVYNRASQSLKRYSTYTNPFN